MRRVDGTYGQGGNTLVIENLPVVSCPNCGESYLTAETHHETNHLRKHGVAPTYPALERLWDSTITVGNQELQLNS